MPSDNTSAPDTRGQRYTFAALCVFAWLLGALGLHQTEEFQAASGLIGRHLDLLYGSLQLFALQSPVKEGANLPLSLQVARFLAPLALAGGVIQIGLNLMRAERDRLLARHLSDHFIIAGLGDKGLAIARALLSESKKVVVLDPSPPHQHAVELRRLGGLLLPIEATDYQQIEAAGIEGARAFIAVTPRDATNMAMAAAMWRSERDEPRRSPLEVLIHVRDIDLRDRVERRQLLQQAGSRTDSAMLEVHLFCAAVNRARLIFERYPFETAGHPDGATATHRQIRLIINATPDAMAVIAIAAQAGHYLGDRKTHVHLLGPRAKSMIAELRESRPNLDQCLGSVEATATGSEWSDFARSATELVKLHPHDCISVFPDLESAPHGLETVLLMSERLPKSSRYRIFISRTSELLLDCENPANSDLASKIAWLPTIDETCGTEAVFKGRLDRLARLIHQSWYAEQLNQIAVAQERGNLVEATRLQMKPALKPWYAADANLQPDARSITLDRNVAGGTAVRSTLTEEQRDSNRSQAHHIPIKIRAAGFDPGNLDPVAWASWCNAQRHEFEQLARMEHNRWSGFQYFHGWQYDSTRDDALKRHDNLVDYDLLKDDIKEADRKACQEVGKMMAQGK
jgi:hypothetical protein